MAQQAQTTPIYRDIDLNFEPHPISNDVPTLVNESAIKQSIKNLLFLQRSEYPFLPLMGCGIKHLLFEPVSPVTSSVIAQEIETTLKNYEPRITVTEIEVTPTADQHGYNMTLSFRVNMEQETQMSLFLEAIR